MLNLARNLGLVTGASEMGAVFSYATAATNIMVAAPETVSFGLRITFLVAAIAMAGALLLSSFEKCHAAMSA
jgi:hypothetical protein